MFWVIIFAVGWAPDHLGTYQMELHGTAECCGSRFGSGCFSLQITNPWSSKTAPNHHSSSSVFDCWCHTLRTILLIMLTRAWYHSVFQHYFYADREGFKYSRQVGTPVGIGSTNFQGLINLHCYSLKLLTHSCSLKKAFLYDSEMYIIFQFWVTLPFFNHWQFSSYFCTISSYSLGPKQVSTCEVSIVPICFCSDDFLSQISTFFTAWTYPKTHHAWNIYHIYFIYQKPYIHAFPQFCWISW